MSALAILGIIVGAFGLIAIIAFAIHKALTMSIKDKNKPTEEEVAKEEVNRLLQDVEDQEVAKQISEFKNDDDDK